MNRNKVKKHGAIMNEANEITNLVFSLVFFFILFRLCYNKKFPIPLMTVFGINFIRLCNIFTSTKGILELLKGRIELNSTLNEGTKFIIWLPIDSQENEIN